jgi:fermentation-respiration switch protein FrsA (DUF1100 family)
MAKLIFSLIIIFLFILYMRFFEKRTIFYPSKIIEFNPSGVGLEYEDVFFNTQDGIALHGWFIPARDAFATVLHCHGNAGNISHRVELARLFNERKMNFFIFDYRGFGKSKGSPGEKGTYLDAQAAYGYLVKTKDIPPERLVVYGKSLGAAIAIDLATKVKAAALISESGFTSTTNLAMDVYKFIPLWLFVTQKYDSIVKIGRINIPKLIIHSQNDEIIPFSHGKKLFEKASEPKEMYIMQGGHNDAFYIYSDKCMQKIEDFLRRHVK